MTEENIRPWGRYDILYEKDNSKVKIIKVEPDKKLSLQYHKKREEQWIIIKGKGRVTVGNLERDVKIGDYVHIPVRAVHRAEAYREGLEFIEVAIGEVDENDIVRLEDDYGRAE
ncbi:MAG: phosphomannose isomerase type II C-terminal cupin domain [archaeon]